MEQNGKKYLVYKSISEQNHFRFEIWGAEPFVHGIASLYYTSGGREMGKPCISTRCHP